ncbi:hypothetical protein L596_006914 [Steinernema carpocapsae]|uniref:Uncharacterized protein n=1 Tax=Steinernema carpocapsae TaxID=34508 RepID=A0A4U5P8B6_STECR|nr:hypothetical protein L596_006914 [Steinernema carpocapsae]
MFSSPHSNLSSLRAGQVNRVSLVLLACTHPLAHLIVYPEHVFESVNCFESEDSLQLSAFCVLAVFPSSLSPFGNFRDTNLDFTFAKSKILSACFSKPP